MRINADSYIDKVHEILVKEHPGIKKKVVRKVLKLYLFNLGLKFFQKKTIYVKYWFYSFLINKDFYYKSRQKKI